MFNISPNYTKRLLQYHKTLLKAKRDETKLQKRRAAAYAHVLFAENKAMVEVNVMRSEIKNKSETAKKKTLKVCCMIRELISQRIIQQETK